MFYIYLIRSNTRMAAKIHVKWPCGWCWDAHWIHHSLRAVWYSTPDPCRIGLGTSFYASACGISKTHSIMVTELGHITSFTEAACRLAVIFIRIGSSGLQSDYVLNWRCLSV